MEITSFPGQPKFDTRASFVQKLDSFFLEGYNHLRKSRRTRPNVVFEGFHSPNGTNGDA
jgi:hypothetical protein